MESRARTITRDKVEGCYRLLLTGRFRVGFCKRFDPDTDGYPRELLVLFEGRLTDGAAK